MVFRKSTRKSTRRVFKRRPRSSYKSRYSRRILYKPMRNSGLFHANEKINLGLFTPANNVTDLNHALTFSIDQVANFVHLTGMYDSYRINKVILTFRPVCTDNNFANSFNYPGKLLVVRDYDDSTALTSQDQYYQYKNCKMMPLASNRKLTIGITPASLSATYQSAVSTAYSPKFKQWIDNSSSNVPHYGVKFGMIRNGAQGAQAAWPATPPSIEVFAQIYYSCKGQR